MIDPGASSGLVSWISVAFLGGTPASLLDLLSGPSPFNHFRVKISDLLCSTLHYYSTIVDPHFSMYSSIQTFIHSLN